jgi:hypothetical protein
VESFDSVFNGSGIRIIRCQSTSITSDYAHRKYGLYLLTHALVKKNKSILLFPNVHPPVDALNNEGHSKCLGHRTSVEESENRPSFRRGHSLRSESMDLQPSRVKILLISGHCGG